MFEYIEDDAGVSCQPLCTHPEHWPPTNIVLSPGLYKYTCPGCGHVTVVRVPAIMCECSCSKGGEDA